MNKLIHIGFGNIVNTGKIIAIVSPDSAPIKRLVQNAKAADKKKYGLSVQKISEIYQENLLAEKMFYVATDEADTNVTDEEAGEAIRKEAAKTASGSALQTEEDTSITQDMIDQQKEKIIRQRQSDMFVKKYNQWLQDKKVDINQSFWNDFTL